MGKYVKNIKVAKNLSISSLTPSPIVLYLINIMFYVDRNVDKNFQLSILIGAEIIPFSQKH